MGLRSIEGETLDTLEIGVNKLKHFNLSSMLLKRAYSRMNQMNGKPINATIFFIHSVQHI